MQDSTTQTAVSLTIADIKKGDWIAVAKMETETKVLEAKQIAVQVKYLFLQKRT